MDPVALAVRNLTVEFPGPAGMVRAVDRVSLEIREGERVALVGETGSGKSVLLLAVLRLLPVGTRISGEVWYRSRDLLRCPPDELRRVRGREVAYIPQGTGGALNPVLTVGSQVAEPLVIHLGLKRQAAFRQATALLARLGIPEAHRRAFEYPHQYSGGMKQRALVAMGVAAEPAVLLADEPTKGVDWARRQEILELFLGLEGKTILTVTHDLWFAERFAHRVAVMYAAEIVEVAPATAFFREPRHPYARALLAALPARGLKPLPGYAPEHAAHQEPGCRFRKRCPRASDRCLAAPPLLEENGRWVKCWHHAS
ncbi:MAG: ABC transporter ATP-binding protein [Desulfotomaculales bacterium]